MSSHLANHSSMHHQKHHNLHSTKTAWFMRGHPTMLLQGDGMTEQEYRASIPTTEELEDIQHNEVIVDYKPEALKPCIELDAQEENVDSNAEYMELSQDGTLESHMMHQDIHQRIQHAHDAKGPVIMAPWLQEMYVWLGIKAARIFSQ